MAKKIPADAFDFYVALGPRRSYEAVAEHFQVSKRSVVSLAVREGWQKRLADLEAKARVASDQRLVESLEAMRERHIKALQYIQGRAIEAMQKMPLESGMEGVRAMRLALRDEMLLRGEPTERTALSIEDTIRREYQRWMLISGGDLSEEGRETESGEGTDSEEPEARS